MNSLQWDFTKEVLPSGSLAEQTRILLIGGSIVRGQRKIMPLNEIVYGWWKKNARWELEWEKKFMETYAWT